LNETKTDELLVSVRGVDFAYDQEKILEDVSLDIHARDVLAIIGPNGGGKTTLLKVILGLLKPSGGSVDWSARVDRMRIGYVPQFATFERDFPLSVRDVVLSGRLHGRRLWQPATATDQRRVEEILGRLGLAAVANKPIGALSGGQLQRVLIARALVVDPCILFLDEPIASIDPDSRFRLTGMLEELKQHIPVVVVTHDITAFGSIVDNIACVNRTLFYHGTTELGSDALEEAYGCPVELVAHGVPHRVLQEHRHTGHGK
jgi:zinc transport system ATP-binding protein